MQPDFDVCPVCHRCSPSGGAFCQHCGGSLTARRPSGPVPWWRRDYPLSCQAQIIVFIVWIAILGVLYAIFHDWGAPSTDIRP